MSKGRKKVHEPVLLPVFIIVILCALFLGSGETIKQGGSLFTVKNLMAAMVSEPFNVVKDESLNLTIKAKDEGNIVFKTSEGYYRYGPSIIEYEDGSYDAWFSAPGNNSTEWDYITYRHSDDGITWSKEKTVLKPTKNSKDRCSVCDPGVIYFDGYYYLGYTSTDDYKHGGMNNNAFVARSKKPEGPYEKWNGNGWGGKPEPILTYTDDPRGWGIGEVSFVLLEKDLYIYYTYFDLTGGYTALAKADACENWPATIEEKGAVIGRTTQDSFDVFYADDLKMFLAFAVEDRMAESSKVAVYVSNNGQSFEHIDSTKRYIEDYAHNLGVAKSLSGHQVIDKDVLIGYAYGRRWGRWDTKFQYFSLSNPVRYKLLKND